jgi:transcriptional regulator with XRE-family HTH domain
MTIKQFRKSKGLSMQELSKMVGLAEFSIERYEKGRIPNKRAMLRLWRGTKGKVQPNDFYLPKAKKAVAA